MERKQIASDAVEPAIIKRVYEYSFFKCQKNRLLNDTRRRFA